MRFFIIALAFGLTTIGFNPVYANPVAGKVESMLSGKELEQTVAKLMISSMAEGLMWANSYNEVTGQNALYCPPSQVGIVDDQYVAIFRQFIGENPTKREDPLGLVILLSLQSVFPCQK